jgi:hypothetical protein
MIKLPEQISDSLAATINCALATMVCCVRNIPADTKKSRKKALIQVLLLKFLLTLLNEFLLYKNALIEL